MAGDRTSTDQIAHGVRPAGLRHVLDRLPARSRQPVRRAPGRDDHGPHRAGPGDGALPRRDRRRPARRPGRGALGARQRRRLPGRPRSHRHGGLLGRRDHRAGRRLPLRRSRRRRRLRRRTTPASRPRSPRPGAPTCPTPSAPAKRRPTCCTRSGIPTSTSAARRTRPTGRTPPACVADTMFFPHDPAHADLLYVLHKSDVNTAWTAFLVRQLGL